MTARERKAFPPGRRWPWRAAAWKLTPSTRGPGACPFHPYWRSNCVTN